MIDLIIILVIGAAFVGGFKLGNRYKSLKDLLQAGLDSLK